MKKRWLLPGAVNLAAAGLAVVAFGVWKQLSPEQVDEQDAQTHMEGSIVSGFFDHNLDDIGFIPSPNKRVTAKKMAGTEVIYDVVYTTGADHFRAVPAADHPERCVLLFGDSFTFGAGVNDDETSAAQIIIKSKGKVTAKNLGVGGWGPHQFLAGLQSGRFRRAITCTPTGAVYLLIPAQIARAAGRSPWDTHGPLYRLDEKAVRPVRAGNFDTNTEFSWRRIAGLNRLTEIEEAELSVALIEEGGRELKRQYPGIHFYVLAWPGISDEMRRRLGARPLEEAIRDFTQAAYQIPIDGHPNPRAYAGIADYILSLP